MDHLPAVLQFKAAGIQGRAQGQSDGGQLGGVPDEDQLALVPRGNKGHQVVEQGVALVVRAVPGRVGDHGGLVHDEQRIAVAVGGQGEPYPAGAVLFREIDLPVDRMGLVARI